MEIKTVSRVQDYSGIYWTVVFDSSPSNNTSYFFSFVVTENDEEVIKRIQLSDVNVNKNIVTGWTYTDYDDEAQESFKLMINRIENIEVEYGDVKLTKAINEQLETKKQGVQKEEITRDKYLGLCGKENWVITTGYEICDTQEVYSYRKYPREVAVHTIESRDAYDQYTTVDIDFIIEEEFDFQE